jgi:Spy/CpxP family protein refolding chaperone
MQKKILIVSVLMVFGFSGLALARHTGDMGCPKGGWTMDPRMISGLNLTPEQTEKVQSLTETFHKDIAPLENRKFQCKTELKLLWMQVAPDVEKIRAKQKELHDLKWQIMEKVMDYRLSFRGMLTPEQLSIYLNRESHGCFGPHGKNKDHGYHMKKRNAVEPQPEDREKE